VDRNRELAWLELFIGLFIAYIKLFIDLLLTIFILLVFDKMLCIFSTQFFFLITF